MTLAALKFKKRTQGTYVRLSLYVHYAKGFYFISSRTENHQSKCCRFRRVVRVSYFKGFIFCGGPVTYLRHFLKGFPRLFPLYHIQFEITVDSCYLIGSQQCDLLMNHFFALNHICSNSLHSCSKSRHFCFKSHHFCSISHHFCFKYK